jgi:catechol 2,3-dioxygenase-like lactoylglutathione lyase family enzyme
MYAIHHATVICPDLHAAVAAYVSAFELQASPIAPMDPDYARRLGLGPLERAPCAWIGTDASAPWLLLIESPQARISAPFQRAGWLALELAVRDVDALSQRLSGSAFHTLAPPADLDFSDAIRATQVQGPAGEVLYLTQIKAAVPPFRLPQTQRWVDAPFVAVMATHDVRASSAFYLGLGASNRMLFETRLGALNGARKLPPETRHAVATVELKSGHLLEIDAPRCALEPAIALDGTQAGLAAIAIANASANPTWRALRGVADELIVLNAN